MSVKKRICKTRYKRTKKTKQTNKKQSEKYQITLIMKKYANKCEHFIA